MRPGSCPVRSAKRPGGVVIRFSSSLRQLDDVAVSFYCLLDKLERDPVTAMRPLYKNGSYLFFTTDKAFPSKPFGQCLKGGLREIISLVHSWILMNRDRTS